MKETLGSPKTIHHRSAEGGAVTRSELLKIAERGALSKES